MADQFNLIVHSFESSIGDPEFGPGQKSREMIFDQACKFNHGFQSRVSGPPEPLFEVGFSSFSLEVIPKPLEFFFKVVGPDNRKVEFEQMGEPSVFLGGEIPGVFEQDETGFFQIDHLLMSQPSDLLCGLRGMALNPGPTYPNRWPEGFEFSVFPAIERIHRGSLLFGPAPPKEIFLFPDHRPG